MRTFKVIFSKFISLCLLLNLGVVLSFSAQAEINHEPWDKLLQDHVRWIKQGQQSCVDYAGFNQEGLEQYLQQVANVAHEDFKTWSEAEQLAFLINAYNAYTIKLILTKYPEIDSIRDLGSLFKSPWKRKQFLLFGKKVHLDHIEHDLVRPNYDEPRIHVALVCAATSCPPLQDQAFHAADLEQQLEQAMQAFLTGFNNYYDASENSLKLSSIFKWYGDDFKPDLLSYLTNYAAQFNTTTDELAKADIDYLDYDWSLNDCP